MYVGGFPCGRKSSFWGLRRFLPLRSPLFSCAESREGRAIYFPPPLLSKHKSLIYETILPSAEPCREQAHGEILHPRKNLGNPFHGGLPPSLFRTWIPASDTISFFQTGTDHHAPASSVLLPAGRSKPFPAGSSMPAFQYSRSACK